MQRCACPKFYGGASKEDERNRRIPFACRRVLMGLPGCTRYFDRRRAIGYCVFTRRSSYARVVTARLLMSAPCVSTHNHARQVYLPRLQGSPFATVEAFVMSMHVPSGSVSRITASPSEADVHVRLSQNAERSISSVGQRLLTPVRDVDHGIVAQLAALLSHSRREFKREAAGADVSLEPVRWNSMVVHAIAQLIASTRVRS